MREEHAPAAWAVMVRWEYRDICDTFAEAKSRAEAITYWEGDEQRTARVQPLYSLAPPTLTEEEREAIETAIRRERGEWYGNPDSRRAFTLRRLLERTT
jgi:hypothetical protein